jgi:hypothetical protein
LQADANRQRVTQEASGNHRRNQRDRRDEVKIAIQEQAPAVQLRRILETKGETTLFKKAVEEAAAGVISLEEACKFREVGAADSLDARVPNRESG